MNSPCQYQRKCIKKGMENMDSDVRVYRVTKFSIWEDHHVCQNTNLMSENESASADLMLSTKPNKHATLHLLKWRSNSLVRLRSWVVQHLNWVTYSCNWKTILIPNENHQSRLLLIINKLCLFFLLWSCWSHYYALYCPPPPPPIWIHGTHYIGIKQPLPHFEFIHILPLMIFSEQVRREGFVFSSWRKFCLLWTFCPYPAISLVNTYWPNAFVPSHE